MLAILAPHWLSLLFWKMGEPWHQFHGVTVRIKCPVLSTAHPSKVVSTATFVSTQVCSLPRCFSKWGLRPAAQQHWGTYQKCQFLGLTPNLLNQRFWGWSPAIWVLRALKVILTHIQVWENCFSSLRRRTNTSLIMRHTIISYSAKTGRALSPKL